jgi:predicted nicotinamide N-methyase
LPAFTAAPSAHIFQAYGIHLLTPKHPLVRQLKRNFKPSIHGHKTWLSSFLLMDYLLHQRPLQAAERVLELGCGWGPAAIFCASKGAEVTGIDSDSQVFPYLDVQSTLNGVEVLTRESRFEDLRQAGLAPYSLLVGSDICFWDELGDIHYKLIKRALKAGVRDIIYTDPGRSPFMALAARCEARLNATCQPWYSTEPERFEGYVLHIRGAAAGKI